MAKHNPQDATLRNIRALKKRVAKLEAQVVAFQGYALRHFVMQKRAKRVG